MAGGYFQDHTFNSFENNVEFTVRVHFSKIFKLKLWLFFALIKLACRLIGMTPNIIDNDND